MWNMDEKGFLISICQALKRIVSYKSLKTGLTRGVMQDGNREFISILASANALGRKMPLGLIYQSDSSDMQDTWVQDFDFKNYEAYFALSLKG
jgi:hypothetical protein